MLLLIEKVPVLVVLTLSRECVVVRRTFMSAYYCTRVFKNSLEEVGIWVNHFNIFPVILDF